MPVSQNHYSAIWLLASLVLPSMDGKRFWDVSQDYSLFDGKSGLLPISIEKEEMSYALYIILSIAVLLSAFLALFLLN